MFLHYAFWVVPDVRLVVRKSANFSDVEKIKMSEKMTFFRVRHYTVRFGSSALIAETDTISLRQQA